VCSIYVSALISASRGAWRARESVQQVCSHPMVHGVRSLSISISRRKDQNGGVAKNIQSPDLLLISSVRNTLRLPHKPNTAPNRGKSPPTSPLHIHRVIHQMQYPTCTNEHDPPNHVGLPPVAFWLGRGCVECRRLRGSQAMGLLPLRVCRLIRITSRARAIVRKVMWDHNGRYRRCWLRTSHCCRSVAGMVQGLRRRYPEKLLQR
jgi:hypothetical protein